ncbi:MAG TPA: hypothetical protein DCG32_05080 [Sphaerochaeta sp.]|nr:hypothetical protein [Sphaerochaeta sp.]
MYYRMQFSSEQVIYTTWVKAKQLLLRVYLNIEAQGGTILDYTLIPTLLDLLIYLPKGKPQFSFLEQHCTLESIAHTKDLLHHYKNISGRLPLSGKNYPLCGTYEAYHGSNCLSSLGKMGPFPQDLSIQTILQEKSSPSGSREIRACQI